MGRYLRLTQEETMEHAKKLWALALAHKKISIAVAVVVVLIIIAT